MCFRVYAPFPFKFDGFFQNQQNNSLLEFQTKIPRKFLFQNVNKAKICEIDRSQSE